MVQALSRVQNWIYLTRSMFSDSACFTDGNPRSELSHCGSLSPSISLILLTKLNISLPVQFCFHEEANGTGSSRNSLTYVLMF